MLIKVMQLDKFTDYALRILVTLTVRAPERVSSAEIAKIFGLSSNHLSKVASELVRLKFINSERGRGGGLTLAHSPEDISIGAVVRGLKYGDPVVECFGSNKSCKILPACGLRQPLAQAKEAFYTVLDDYSLEDVTKSKSALNDILSFV